MYHRAEDCTGGTSRYVLPEDSSVVDVCSRSGVIAAIRPDNLFVRCSA